jgi:hypothetical protein
MDSRDAVIHRKIVNKIQVTAFVCRRAESRCSGACGSLSPPARADTPRSYFRQGPARWKEATDKKVATGDKLSITDLTPRVKSS